MEGSGSAKTIKCIFTINSPCPHDSSVFIQFKWFRFCLGPIILVAVRFAANNNEKFRSFKSKENFHKKEVGPYRGFGYLSLISDPTDLTKGVSEKYCKIAIFNMAVVSKTDISRKIPKYITFV